MKGSLSLSEYPGDVVRLSCTKCNRKGQYRKQSLIERFGPNIPLPDLRQEIAQRERRENMSDVCLVRYTDLIPSSGGIRRAFDVRRA
jgi:hypothetical protein